MNRMEENSPIIKRKCLNKMLLKKGDRVRVSWFPNKICKISSMEADGVVIETNTRVFKFPGGGAVIEHKYAYVDYSRIMEIVLNGELKRET